MILHSNILGKENKKQVLILHGLYGNSDSWFNIGKSLSSEYCVHLVDLRNHGKSFHSDIHNYNVMAEDIKNYAYHYNIEKCSIIGHSMGGKTALFFSEKYPEMLEKIIIADISPRSYKSLTENDLIANLHLNLISAMKNLNISEYHYHFEIKEDLDIFDDHTKNIILKNLGKNSGKFEWRLNINSLFNNLDYIMDGIDIEKHIDNKINVNCLFLKAENSGYICDNDKKIINFIFSNCKIVEIKNAGHWLHIDQPEIVKNEIKKFL